MKKIVRARPTKATLLRKFLGNAMLVPVAVLGIASPAFAQGGLSKISDFFTNINNILNTVSVAAVTVAVCWSGYELIFGAGDKRLITKILIGGVIIGAAGQIANMLVGT